MDEARWFDEKVLSTKFFVPSSSHALIARPQLTSLLKEGLRRKLTLISAPAGFGKTTLISAWVQSLPQEFPEASLRVAWVSLDEGDDDPVLFWTYALTALDRQLPGLCAPLLEFLPARSAAKPPLLYVLQALINMLVSRAEEFLLVLDDYHVITRPEIHNSLTYLLEHLPPQLHLVMATRADPPLPLAMLRARRQVLEVRTNQLRCTREEVTAFFEVVMGVQFPTEIIGEVTSRTEGWLVGLQLLGLSLQELTDPANLLQEVSGSQHYILEYLVEEVLRRQPPEVQTFLLRTSILEQLSASLCDAVLQQTVSLRILQFLERANVFVTPLDGQRQWYRYHALFAEALRSRLAQTEGESAPALHLRASQWYAEQGSFSEAIRHAVSANDWERSAELIEHAHAFLLDRGEHALVRRWLEQLPVEVVRARPRLCLAYVKTLNYLVAPYTVIEDWLRDAETAVRAVGELEPAQTGTSLAGPSSEHAERDNLLGEIAAQRAYLNAFFVGDGPAALAFCEEALAHLSMGDFRARELVAFARCVASHASGDIVAAIEYSREATSLALAVGDSASAISWLSRTVYFLLVQGKLHEAARVAEQSGLPGMAAVGLPHVMVCMLYCQHARVLLEWNRLDEALDRVIQAIRLSEQSETAAGIYLGYTVLMRVYLARGELEAARSAFQQAETTLSKSGSLNPRDAYIIFDFVQFCLASGELDRAALWVENITRLARVPYSLYERRDVTQARILLARKRPAEALSLLRPLEARAEQQQRWSHVIEMTVLQALAYQTRQQEQEALAALGQALRLAEPEGYVRTFVDEGDAMATLLARLREREGSKHGPTPYIDTLLAAFPSRDMASEYRLAETGQDMAWQRQPDPLSERERQVLRLLVRGDSNQKIAETLVLSIDTIKRHVSNIFSKLGVHSRVQAVAQARARGLLSDEPSRR